MASNEMWAYDNSDSEDTEPEPEPEPDPEPDGGSIPQSSPSVEPMESEESVDYDLSENIAEDIVTYSRSQQVKNEEQTLLMTLGYLSGWMENPSHYISGVAIGTPGSGKTNMQGKVEKLFDGFPEDEQVLYENTTGSDKAIIYDDDWDTSMVASLDELNKPSDDVIEILKGLHGDDEKFVYNVTGEGEGADRDTDRIIRYAKPYWFLYAQFDPDFELWDRMLKLPVHEGQAKNEAVVKMQFDHHNIEFSDTDHTYDFEFEDGTTAIQQHLTTIPKESWVKLPAGEDEYGWDVEKHVRPIFEIGRSQVNRVSGMVANLIRASALLNYKNREQKTIHIPNVGVRDAFIAEKQDVANVLSCRDTLLATTHGIDDRNRIICQAIDEKTGKRAKASIADIAAYIRDSNASTLNRDTIKNILANMQDNNLIEKFERGGQNGEHVYEFSGWHNFGKFKITDGFKRAFSDTKDPVRGVPFVKSAKNINESILPGATDFHSDENVSSSPQAQLVEETVDVELDPHEEVVYRAFRENMDGVTLDNLLEHDPSIYEMCGVLPMGVEPEDPDVSGTLFDPEEEHWYQKGRPDEWVETKDDTFDEVNDVIAKLHREGVVETEVIDKKKGEPTSMKFEVKKVTT